LKGEGLGEARRRLGLRRGEGDKLQEGDLRAAKGVLLRATLVVATATAAGLRLSGELDREQMGEARRGLRRGDRDRLQVGEALRVSLLS